VATLEIELTAFENALGLSEEDALLCGDLAFWPFSPRHQHERSDPTSFWMAHRPTFGTGIVSEYVIGELGRNLLTANQTEHVDEYRGRCFRYGTSEESAEKAEIVYREGAIDDENEWDEPGYSDSEFEPYADRLFYTFGAGEWFESIGAREETPSFGRKLLILVARDNLNKGFLESRIGERLRVRLGQAVRIVLNGQGADVVAIAFQTDATPVELFEQIKSLIPPRLIEDFLIADIGMNYCVGERPISLFAEWDDQQRSRKQSFAQRREDETARSADPSAVENQDQGRLEHARAGWASIKRAKNRWYPPPGWLPRGG
jgi:hypothetical protein